MTDVEQRLREIEERASKASEGPWSAKWGYVGARRTLFLSRPDYDGVLFGLSDSEAENVQHRADTEFAAEARQDIPWLLSLLREREEEIRRLRTLLERARIGAWHEACGDHADPDPCWHCCDWRELAEEIDAALRGEQP